MSSIQVCLALTIHVKNITFNLIWLKSLPNVYCVPYTLVSDSKLEVFLFFFFFLTFGIFLKTTVSICTVNRLFCWSRSGRSGLCSELFLWSRLWWADLSANLPCLGRFTTMPYSPVFSGGGLNTATWDGQTLGCGVIAWLCFKLLPVGRVIWFLWCSLFADVHHWIYTTKDQTLDKAGYFWRHVTVTTSILGYHCKENRICKMLP